MKKAKILVVDDSEFDRNLLVKALSRKADFSTEEAASGEQCLQFLATSTVDLILMDIMMPGTPGTAALLEIRRRFNPIELPVIMVTSKVDSADVIECLQNGANDYITKPVQFDVAVSRISTHVQLAEMSRQMSKLNEIAALSALITTYHHEINNPLAIAIACMNKGDWASSANREKVESALWRVADIVKKIKDVAEKQEIEYQQYAGSKMVKLK